MKIYGTIKDSYGETIPGANITMIFNPAIIDASDLDGKFEIDNAEIKNNTEFRISYIGYKNKILPASQLKGNIIILEEDQELLDEVLIKQPPKTTSVNNSVKNTGLKEHFKKYAIPYSILGVLVIVVGSIMIIKKTA